MPVSKPTVHSRPARRGNFTSGRNTRITEITAHHIVGDAPAAINRFSNTNDGISSTYIIGADGTIYQSVADGDTPHTNGNFASNSRSITIEHAGGHSNVPYTDAMYNASIQLVAWLIQTYGINTFRRHRDIIATACPGGLNVEHIINNAKALLNQPAPAQNGDNEMIVNADQAIKIYKMLRPNGSPSQSEIDGTAGRRSFAEFVNTAQAEVNSRDAGIRNTANEFANLRTHSQNLQHELDTTRTAQNHLQATILNLQKQVEIVQADDLNDKQAVTDGLAKIATLSKQLEVLYDTQAGTEATIIQAQTKAPSATKASWFVRFLAAITNNK